MCSTKMRKKTRKRETRALGDRDLTERAGKGHFQVVGVKQELVQPAWKLAGQDQNKRWGPKGRPPGT